MKTGQPEIECSLSENLTFEGRLQTYAQSVERLLEDIPRLCALLQSPVKAGLWDALQSRYRAFKACLEKQITPPLVVTLYGPSGAGKSTIFRWLTGLDVPAGDHIRPVTRRSVIAVPPEICRDDILQPIFPGFDLVPLVDKEDLKLASSGSPRLHYAVASRSQEGLPFILADVPDFNTVECKNWEEAERMLSRAELTIFLVYQEGYSDKRIVEMLAQCCRVSERLVYVFTKTPPEAAKTMWQHLLQIAKDSPEFGESRRDGQSLAEFLARSWCYYSPRLPLDGQFDDLEIKPLDDNQPEFQEWLSGQVGEDLVIGGLAQSAAVAIPYCREVLNRTQSDLRMLERNIRKAKVDLRRGMKNVVSQLYPIGGFLEELKAVCREMSPKVVRFLGERLTLKKLLPRASITPFDGLVSIVKAVRSEGDHGAASALPVSTGQPLEELEKENALRSLQEVVGKWRKQFQKGEDLRTCSLSAERCDNALRRLREMNWPLPSSDWRKKFRPELEAWVREHRWWAYGLLMSPAFKTLGTVTGLSLIVVDLALTGGLFGTIGTLTLAGSGAAGGSLIANILLEYLRQAKLEKVAKQAHQAWQKQRSRELYHHLWEHCGATLLQPWLLRFHQLKSYDIRANVLACDELERLARDTRIQP